MRDGNFIEVLGGASVTDHQVASCFWCHLAEHPSWWFTSRDRMNVWLGADRWQDMQPLSFCRGKPRLRLNAARGRDFLVNQFPYIFLSKPRWARGAAVHKRLGLVQQIYVDQLWPEVEKVLSGHQRNHRQNQITLLLQNEPQLNLKDTLRRFMAHRRSWKVRWKAALERRRDMWMQRTRGVCIEKIITLHFFLLLLSLTWDMMCRMERKSRGKDREPEIKCRKRQSFVPFSPQTWLLKGRMEIRGRHFRSCASPLAYHKLKAVKSNDCRVHSELGRWQRSHSSRNVKVPVLGGPPPPVSGCPHKKTYGWLQQLGKKPIDGPTSLNRHYFLPGLFVWWSLHSGRVPIAALDFPLRKQAAPPHPPTSLLSTHPTPLRHRHRAWRWRCSSVLLASMFSFTN